MHPASEIDFTDRRIGDILDDIYAIQSPVEKGRVFERLCRVALPQIPAIEGLSRVVTPYREEQRDAPLQTGGEPAKIWGWKDWPEKTDFGFSIEDTGIDIVAEHMDGHYIAIQCKCYSKKASLAIDDISGFVSRASTKENMFREKWLITTRDINPKAYNHIQKSGISLINFNEYADHVVDKKQIPRTPWPIQQEAIDATVKRFTDPHHPITRGRLIMACGTGKTFTALRIAERLVPQRGNILFIVPSIALVQQTRKEWLRHCTGRMTSIVVCSDNTSGEDISTTELACRITTDPEHIAALLKQPPRENTHRVVFSTYQSLDKVATAQLDAAVPDFDIAFADEAHRTTNQYKRDTLGNFQRIHEDGDASTPDEPCLRIARRIYMTATPRIYDKRNLNDPEKHAVIIDMENLDIYGEELYRVDFATAVQAGMLCDYRVICLKLQEGSVPAGLEQDLIRLSDSIEGKGKRADEQTRISVHGIGLGLNGLLDDEEHRQVMKRAIVYSGNIMRSKFAAQALRMVQEDLRSVRARTRTPPPLPNLHTHHLDGTNNGVTRRQALDALRDEADEDNIRVITNAKLFTEGLDVPSLDAIAFLDPKQSKIDTIQAVGRVMRRDQSQRKRFGYIIVPVILPPNMDIIEALTHERSRFKPLAEVLQALQSHDPDLLEKLDEKLEFKDYQVPPLHHEGEQSPPPTQETLLNEEVKQAIYATIAKNAGISREQHIRTLVDYIIETVRRAAHLFENEDATTRIAEVIGTPPDNPKETTKTAALLIFNACVMHKRLEQVGSLRDLPKLSKAYTHADPAAYLALCWQDILKKDYEPIFRDAQNLIQALQPRQQIIKALKMLIESAMQNAKTLGKVRFDHAGPLYHKILGSAQSDGAYYTKNLSAYLLARLALNDRFTDWSDPEKVRALRVVDPACGTGTLLIAAMSAIGDNAAAAQGLDKAAREALSKHLVERAIYGYDINKQAIQLAACNLTIGSPNADYNKINLYGVPHGPKLGTPGETTGEVNQGTLEMLMLQDDRTLIEKAHDKANPVSAQDTMRRQTEFPAITDVDLVICNPPFTDTSRLKKFTTAQNKAMAERMWQIKKHIESIDPLAAKAIVRMSIRPYFTPLLHQMLAVGGTLAKILPTTACTAGNGQAERTYLAHHNHIEMVITCHDPKYISFSENTDIHESLVVCRRSQKITDPTRFIQLKQYPKDKAQADEIITALQQRTESDLFTETLWPAEKIKQGNWSPCQWLSPALAVLADELHTLMPAGNAHGTLKPIIDIYQWGVAPREVRGTFEHTESKDGEAFFTTSADILRMLNPPLTYDLHVRSGKQERAEKIRARAGHLFLPTRRDTRASRMTAIFSEKPAISGRHDLVEIENIADAKACAIFLNSTFGVIQLLNLRSGKLTYPKLESSMIRNILIPNPAKIDLKPLATLFDQLNGQPFGRFDEYDNDPKRRQLDRAVAKALGIDPQQTDRWRRWLSAEPTLRGNPDKGSKVVVKENRDSE